MQKSAENGSCYNDYGRVKNTNPCQDGSDGNNKSLRTTVQNNLQYESIPPFIRSSIVSSVQKAIQQRKIFSLGHSSYRTVKQTLIRRGWIQKTEYEEATLKPCKRPEDLEELYTQSLLRGAPVTLLWTRIVSDWNRIDPITLVNRFPQVKEREHFCSKIGLNNNLQDAYWFHEDGVSSVKFPRTYNLQNSAEVISFIDDYVITACNSLLKIIIGERTDPTDSYNLFQIGGKIPVSMIYFAIKKCDDYITFREHGDLDEKQNTNAVKRTVDGLMKMYDNYLTNYYRIVDQKDSFEMITAQEMKDLHNNCRLILQSFPKFLPQIDSDGFRNLWLVKDSDLSCGQGVWVLRNLTEILNADKDPDRKNTSRYIVQKYIERPLLIYNTKFDVRQWFLLTRVDPLQIWMYRESYLRFSSQPFTLDDTHEAVHLCNNSVQKKYTVNTNRHPGLPQNNMWDSEKFREYLKYIGEEDKWAKVIYPSMKASIISALQVSQEDMVDRENSFELYGADFIITEDFSPWLIEINSSPAMHASTSVTRRLCSQCFRDVIKVVIDYRKNQQASTGDFELIYQQYYFYKQVNPEFNFANIFTHGTQLKLPKNQNQTGPTTKTLKSKKLKNIDIGPKIFLQKQRINSTNRTINKENKQTTNLDDRKTNPSGNISIKSFLRSSQKIKYVLLPQITTVNRTYFQVVERNNTVDVSEQQFQPELIVPMLRILSNTKLKDLGINVITMAMKTDTNKNNIIPLQDFNPLKRKPKEPGKRQKLISPIDDVQKEAINFEVDYPDFQNDAEFLSERLKFEHDSGNIEVPQTRNYEESIDIVFSNDSCDTKISNYCIGSEENIDLKRKLELNHNIQVDSSEAEFNEQTGNNECSFTTKFQSRNPTDYLEESFFRRAAEDNDQMVVSNKINRKYLLNIYLTLKKKNVDLYDTNNDRSFVEIESAKNVINYIFFIQHNDLQEKTMNNENTSLSSKNIPVIQELEQTILDGTQTIHTSINDTIMYQLKEDIFTRLNRECDQHFLQPQECTMIQRPSDTNEISDQCRRKNPLKKRSREEIFTKIENVQKGSSSGFIHQNNQVISFRRILTGVILSILIIFSGYIVLFQNLHLFDWININ